MWLSSLICHEAVTNYQHCVSSSYFYKLPASPHLCHDSEEGGKGTEKGEGRSGCNVASTALVGGSRARAGAGGSGRGGTAAAAGGAAAGSALATSASSTTLDDTAGTRDCLVLVADGVWKVVGGDDHLTSNGVKLREGEVAEGSHEGGGTCDVGESRKVDVASEASVVLDGQGAVAGGVGGKVERGHVVVVVDDQTLRAAKLRQREVGKPVASESSGVGDVLESTQVNRRAVADGDGTSAGEVTERGHGLASSVGVETDLTRDRAQRNVNIRQILVVGDGERRSACEVDAVQVLEEGVLDVKITNVPETCGPAKNLETRAKNLEVQAANAGKVGEGKRADGGQAGHSQCSLDVGEGG